MQLFDIVLLIFCYACLCCCAVCVMLLMLLCCFRGVNLFRFAMLICAFVFVCGLCSVVLCYCSCSVLFVDAVFCFCLGL